jgi:hypothetical protein
MFGNFHRSLIVNPKPYCFKSPSNSYIVMYSNVHCVDLVNTKTICPYTSEASMQFSCYWALSKKNAMAIKWMYEVIAPCLYATEALMQHLVLFRCA